MELIMVFSPKLQALDEPNQKQQHINVKPPFEIIT